jgi:hypothetical protein
VTTHTGGLAGEPGFVSELLRAHRAIEVSDLVEFTEVLAAAEALDLPLSLHTATRRQGRIRGAGDKTLRVASPAEMFWADIPSPVSHLEGDREFADSPLEEAGFEPSPPAPAAVPAAADRQKPVTEDRPADPHG